MRQAVPSSPPRIALLASLAALSTSQLRELHVPQMERLGPDALDALVTALRRGSLLVRLDLRATRLRPDAALNLADALAYGGRRLEALDLGTTTYR